MLVGDRDLNVVKRDILANVRAELDIKALLSYTI